MPAEQRQIDGIADFESMPSDSELAAAAWPGGNASLSVRESDVEYAVYERKYPVWALFFGFFFPVVVGGSLLFPRHGFAVALLFVIGTIAMATVFIVIFHYLNGIIARAKPFLVVNKLTKHISLPRMLKQYDHDEIICFIRTDFWSGQHHKIRVRELALLAKIGSGGFERVSIFSTNDIFYLECVQAALGGIAGVPVRVLDKRS